MQTVNIGTRDSEIEIHYGMIKFREEPRAGAIASVKYMYSDLTDIRKYYIRLGFHLAEFDRCCYYTDFGYASLVEFCEKNLGMDKSAVSRCINVYENFNASREVSYNSGIKSTGAAIDLGERWQDYSYTQLCEMLPLTDAQRRDITPDMSVKQIREYKKQLKNKPVASTQQGKKFDYEKFVKLNGAAEAAYVKSCTAINQNSGHDKVLWIFDKSGNRLDFCNKWVSVLEDSSSRLVIRV